MTSDAQLLAEYRAGSQPAFTELVRRHIDWVYSSALRRVRDAHLAEDVTQAVFIALAYNGPAREGVVMSGWLFTVMRYASAKILRSESRRRNRETQAARRRETTTSSSDEQLQDVLPLLEQAMDRLNRRDRQAILLRFYQRQSFAQVGATLGISEEGARKRVSRAVMKLRQRMGTMIPAAALAEQLLIHSTTAAPSNLALSIAESSLQSPLARAVIQAMKLRALLPAAGCAAAILAVVAVSLGMRLALADGTAPQPAEPPNPAATTPPAGAAVETEPATRPTDITLDQIIAGVKTAEGSIQNLHIKGFETTEELLLRGATQWVFTPERSTGSAWYDGNPRGKTRIYFSDSVAPMIGGTWIEQVLDFSWDGKEARCINIASGMMGTALGGSRHPQANIIGSQDLLPVNYPRWETGAGYTLQYFVEIQDESRPVLPRVPVSEDLEKVKTFRIPVEISAQLVNGFDAVRVRVVEKAFDKKLEPFTYWFDPSRGYALVRYELKKYHSANGQPLQEWTETLDVKELKEIASGVWFPLRASVSRADLFAGAYRRYNYHAVDAVANDPHFDPSIFQAKFPVGYLVVDSTGREEKRFMLMPDGTTKIFPRPPFAVPLVTPAPATRPDGDDVVP